MRDTTRKRDPLKGVLLLSGVALASCGPSGNAPDRGKTAAPEPSIGWDVAQYSSQRVGVIEGFSGPESARYEPDQDVWFVSNLDGDGEVRDGNGYVSRLTAETGRFEALRFAERTEEHPLHAPRGICLVGDTLWVADIDGVHGFDRRTEEALAYVDLTPLTPGFLNDIVQGPDGALYVTDTERSSVYRSEGRAASIALADTVLGGPNGIEPYRHRLLMVSQSDSSIDVMDEGETRILIRTPGRPADIGLDTRRRRLAVPYVDLNRVDLWRLPG